MITFCIDFVYVLAGISAALSYTHGGVEQLCRVAAAYALIAILFQFFAHVFENILMKKFDKYKQAKNIGIVIIAIILSTLITECIIPIQKPF